MVGGMILLTLVSVAVAVGAGALWNNNYWKNSKAFGLILISVFLLSFALMDAFQLGNDRPKLERYLNNHAIYEVLSVTLLNDGSYAVWLRTQDGAERVYTMKTSPPQPRFQVTGNGENRQYLPYPPLSPQPTN